MSDTTTDTPRCSARRRDGRQCSRRPILGGTVCWTHGGSAPQVRRAADRRLEQAAMARQVEAWGGRMEISAPEALMELVQAKAAEVAYWNRRVAALDESDRAGLLVSKEEQGPVDVVTRQVGPSVFVVLLHRAQDQLAAYCAAAVKAGLDEAMVKVAALQGEVILQVARLVVAAARASDAGEDDVIRGVLEAWHA